MKTKRISVSNWSVITTILCIVFLFLEFSTLYGQRHSTIKTMPHLAQGYLILNQDADIDYWTVEIIKRTYNLDGSFSDENLQRNELIGKNYLRIPNSIINDCGQPGYGYVINVVTHYMSGELETEEGDILFPPSNAPQGQEYNSVTQWNCNGNTYAWSIHQFLSLYNNNSYFALSGLVESYNNGIMEYYFQYFSETQWQNLVTAINNNFNIGNIPYYHYYNIPDDWLNINGTTVIKIPNNSGIIYKDQYGVQINSSWVYGLAKGLGPWCDLATGQGCSWTPILLYGSSMAYMPKSWAIGIINQHANLTACGAPALECIDNSYTNPFVSSGSDVIAIESISEAELDSIVWIWGEIEDISEIIKPTLLDWWNSYHGFSIIDVSSNGGVLFNGTISDLRDSNGNITSPTLHLNPGLYSVNLQMTNGAYLSVIREVKSEGAVSSLSSHFNYSIYPVPFIENQFNLEIEASTKLEVLYRIFDINSNLLYETTIHMDKGDSKIIQIAPEITLPYGYLVNQFSFADGSQLCCVTQRSEN